MATAATQPEFSSNLLDRQLIALEISHIKPIIYFTKTDLLSTAQRDQLQTVAMGYQAIPYDVIFPEQAFDDSSLDELQTLLAGKENVIMGQTGAGKSTLLNHLAPELNLKTGEISAALNRGKHTTRKVALLQVGTGLIADTPGFSSYDTLDIDYRDLANYFPEFKRASVKCRFRGCVHVNEPDCEVKREVSDGIIMESRYTNYLQLYTDIKNRKPNYKKNKVRKLIMIKVAPSILSADYVNLQRDIEMVDKGGAELLHIDIMDGAFVPALSYGPGWVKAIRPITDLTLDVHMMVQSPERYIDTFADAGADIIGVHTEATPHIHRALQMIKNKGVKAEVVINPGTPVAAITPVLYMVDQVLVMTVNPGFGGQKFLPETVKKIAELNEIKKNPRDLILILKLTAALMIRPLWLHIKLAPPLRLPVLMFLMMPIQYQEFKH